MFFSLFFICELLKLNDDGRHLLCTLLLLLNLTHKAFLSIVALIYFLLCIYKVFFVVFIRLPFLSSFCLRFSRLFPLVLTAFRVSSFFFEIFFFCFFPTFPPRFSLLHGFPRRFFDYLAEFGLFSSIFSFYFSIA